MGHLSLDSLSWLSAGRISGEEDPVGVERERRTPLVWRFSLKCCVTIYLARCPPQRSGWPGTNPVQVVEWLQTYNGVNFSGKLEEICRLFHV